MNKNQKPNMPSKGKVAHNQSNHRLLKGRKQPPVQRRPPPPSGSDFDYEKLDQFLNNDKIVKTLQINRKFLKISQPSDGPGNGPKVPAAATTKQKSPLMNPRQLRTVFHDIIGRMEWLEHLELKLEPSSSTQPQQRTNSNNQNVNANSMTEDDLKISGKLLASALTSTRRLEILKVHSGLEFEGARDIQYFATALSSHKETLLELSFRNIKVHQGTLFRKLAGAIGRVPVLDPLMLVAGECSKLKVFELVCAEVGLHRPTTIADDTITTTTNTTTERSDNDNLETQKPLRETKISSYAAELKNQTTATTTTTISRLAISSFFQRPQETKPKSATPSRSVDEPEQQPQQQPTLDSSSRRTLISSIKNRSLFSRSERQPKQREEQAAVAAAAADTPPTNKAPRENEPTGDMAISRESWKSDILADLDMGGVVKENTSGPSRLVLQPSEEAPAVTSESTTTTTQAIHTKEIEKKIGEEIKLDATVAKSNFSGDYDNFVVVSTAGKIEDSLAASIDAVTEASTLSGTTSVAPTGETTMKAVVNKPEASTPVHAPGVQSIPSSDHQRPMISALSIEPLCESKELRRLNLSNLSLTDDHFLAISQKIAANSKSVLTQLILNLNQNTDLGLDMILMQLLNKEDGSSSLLCPPLYDRSLNSHSSPFFASKIKTFQAYQKHRLISQASSDYLEEVMKRNVTIINLQVNSKSNKMLQFYVQLNKVGRKRLFGTHHTTWSQWVKLLEYAGKKNPDLLYYCLRESVFWWKCRYLMALAKETAPALPTPSGSVGHDDGSSTQRQWHLQPSIDGIDDRIVGQKFAAACSSSSRSTKESDDGDNDFEHDHNNKDIVDELQEMGLSELLDLQAEHNGHESMVSNISMGDDTYVRDLVRQKEDRAEIRQEEALEEALDLYEIAKVETNMKADSDDLFKAIFQQVLKDLNNARREEDKAHDELVERELYLKRVQKEQEEMRKKKEQAHSFRGDSSTTSRPERRQQGPPPRNNGNRPQVQIPGNV